MQTGTVGEGGVAPAGPHLGFEVVMKKSGLANSVNVGVRCGSAVTMCSVFSPTLSARYSVSGLVELLTYGSLTWTAAASRSSFRRAASVRTGLPFTYTVGAE